MTDPEEIRTLEELGANAWPAVRRLLFDGWLLGLSQGYTKRANSVLPLYPGRLDPDRKIVACQDFYAGFGQPAVFKLSAAALPPDLDRRLAAAGYEKIEESLVLVRDLDRIEPEPGTAIGLAEELPAGWIEGLARLAGLPASSEMTLQAILAGLANPACFAWLDDRAGPLARGLGVLERGRVGLLDIIVRPERRRQGLAGRLVRALLAWARSRGAAGAWLQVTAANRPGLGLYAGLGFREAYRYWYRIKEVRA